MGKKEMSVRLGAELIRIAKSILIESCSEKSNGRMEQIEIIEKDLNQIRNDINANKKEMRKILGDMNLTI